MKQTTMRDKKTIFAKFLCMLPVAVARFSNDDVAATLCISGFLDDAVFSYYGPNSGVSLRQQRIGTAANRADVACINYHFANYYHPIVTRLFQRIAKSF